MWWALQIKAYLSVAGWSTYASVSTGYLKRLSISIKFHIMQCLCRYPSPRECPRWMFILGALCRCWLVESISKGNHAEDGGKVNGATRENVKL